MNAGAAVSVDDVVDDLRETEATMLAERLGISPAEAAGRVNEEIHGTWEATLDRVPLFPHVREVLVALREAGMRLGVLSDFPVTQKLKRLGLDPHQRFDQLAMDVEQMGDPAVGLEQLPELLGNCVACHAAYRFEIEAPTP